MKAGDKPKVQALRLVSAAVKQKEIDERIELDDAQVIVILDKLSKQRRESIEQYRKAERVDLLEQEEYELKLIAQFLPEALSAAEVEQLITAAISNCNASSLREMGKVMAELKPQLQGRADLTKVSALIKARLGS